MELRYSLPDAAEAARSVYEELMKNEPVNIAVAMRGDLGAGKTTLVRSLVSTMGGNPSRVQSPSFSLINRYALSGNGYGLREFIHVDFYRLQEVDNALLAPLEESLYYDEGIVIAAEWAERSPRYMTLCDYVVDLKIVGPETRKLTVRELS